MTKVKALSLRKNFTWNFFGNLVFSFSQWLIIILLAKIGNPEIVGLYSLGLAITAPILMLTNLQLRAVQATDTSNEYKFNVYYGLRIITGGLAIVITLIFIFLNNYNNYKSIVIILVAISKILDSYSDVIYGHLQQKERMDYIGQSRIIKGVVTLIVMGVTLLITNDLLISLIVLNISWFLVFYFFDRKMIEYFVNNSSPNFNFNKIKSIILLSVPLGIVLMLGSLNTNIPRIIVEKYLGEVALGYFAAIAYLTIAGNKFINAVGQAAVPRLAKLYKSNSIIGYKKLLFKLIGIGFLIGFIGLIISISFGDLLLKVIYDTSYTKYSNILILIMIAGTFNFIGAFLGHGLTSMRLFKVQPYLNSVGLIISIVGSLTLIPYYGLSGAAFTLILTSITKFLLISIVLFRNLKRKSKIKTN